MVSKRMMKKAMRKLRMGQKVFLKGGSLPYYVERLKADNRVVLSAPLVNDINVGREEISDDE